MINWERVSELYNDIGPDDFSEVVELFLLEVEETIGAIKSANPSEILEDHLHFLKGSALNLGFQHFSDLCAKGEAEAGRGHSEDVDLDAIFACFANSKAQLAAGKGGL